MINRNTIFFDGRKIGTYKSVLTAGTGHIEFEGFKPYEPTLNENQQVVLEWLKNKYTITDIEPIELIWRLHVNTKNKYREQLAYRACKSLTSQAQLEVLQAFSQWVLEQEELNE